MNDLVRHIFSTLRRAKIAHPGRLLSQHHNQHKARAVQDAEDDGPIRYTQSPAFKWMAKASRTGEAVPRLWYEPYVILGSLTIFMVYFCVLREENQIDRDLERTLYSRISGLEELQLHATLQHNRALGQSTTDIEARLRELKQTLN